MRISCFDFSSFYEAYAKAVSEDSGDGLFFAVDDLPPVPFCRIDCSDVCGCTACCEKESFEMLRARAASHGVVPEEIHLLDNGNYHYLSLLTTSMIRVPYTLVLLDHHPDCHSPAFGNLLSCGSWVAEALRKQPLLKRVVICGAERSLYEEERAFLLREEKRTGGAQSSAKLSYAEEDALWKDFDGVLHLIPEENPVYLSVDKDILSVDSLRTNWEQGTLSLTELCAFLRGLAQNRSIIGVDICGAPAALDFAERERNRKADTDIIRVILSRQQNQDKKYQVSIV